MVRQRSNGERVIHRLRWGLVPSWAKDEAIATRLINARGESVAEKPSFRAAFRRRRCIVPANGFYEWQQLSDRQGGGKQPFYIHPVGGEFFALAGLWVFLFMALATFSSADYVVDGKIVFDVGGNKYRIVGLVGFRAKRIFILFVGTHAEYDKIDVAKL